MAGAVLALLAAVAVGCGGGDGAGDAVPVPTVRDGASDQERALAALLTADVLPPEAEVVGSAVSDPPVGVSVDGSRDASAVRFEVGCGRGRSGMRLPALAQARSPNFRLPGEVVVNNVAVFQDSEVAQSLIARLRSPAMLACIGAESTESVRMLADGVAGVRVGRGRARVLDFPQVGDASLAIGIDVPVVEDGERTPFPAEVFFVQEGRAVSNLMSVMFATRPGRDNVGIARLIADRLVASFE